MDNTLTPAPVPDRFEHETPLRAFSDWNETGLYAIGKGLRPSVAHLPVYLDAIERKEGWQLVQMLLDDKGNFRSAIFRRDPADIVQRYRNAYPQVLERIANGLGIDPAKLREDFRSPEPYDYLYRKEKAVNERQIADGMRDDPVNPKHYGGTACADIGERLTANCYQVLKYCWRLGEKDDPKIELGKAIWYAEREKALGFLRSRASGRLPRKGIGQGFVVERTRNNRWRRQIALLLWDMCYGTENLRRWSEHLDELIELLKERLRQEEDNDRGRGLEP